MPFQIIRNDITKVKADIIVNSANPRPVVGGGTDTAVYRAAGEELLLAERKKIGDLMPGSAAATPAFHLPAKHIIHTVGPVWVDGLHGERDVLRSCYSSSLDLADRLGAESIAFPMIATGVYGFPRDEALNIALSEIGRFLLTHEMNIILVVFERATFELSEALVGEIETFIDDHGVRLIREAEFDAPDNRRESSAAWRRRQQAENRQKLSPPCPNARPAAGLPQEAADAGYPFTEDFVSDGMAGLPEFSAPAALPDMEGKTLEEIIGEAGKTFQQKLFELIDQSGMDDVTVYKRANINRKLFPRIRSRADYRPTKKTALAFAIALKLDFPAMQDLLSRAEIAFSPSSPFDLIVAYFVTHGNYNIFEINAALFKYGQPILGG